jgi:putative tryptophan/tyrosine transport system substrate-binding protein
MLRRDFIRGIVASATCALDGRAQPSARPVIGYLSSRSRTEDARFVAAFLSGLKEAGYVQDQNISIEYRFADNQYDRLAALAVDLVDHQATILMTGGAPSAPAAAKAVAPSVSIVFVTGGNPVERGLVASLDHPGGNLTGVNVLNTELSAKRLQLLREIIPSAKIFAILVNPTNPNVASQVNDFQTAAHSLGLQLEILRASTEAELNVAFATAAKTAAGGLIIGSDAFFNGESRNLGALALNRSIPAVSLTREFAAAGGLMSYGASIAEAFHIASGYVARILKGEKPADLPVQQSTKVELIINLKTAKTLGLTIPLPFLGRADEVIE